nr:potassium channel protein [Deinobacterium chartae]
MASLIALGTLGYVLLEGWSFLDGLYMTLMVLTTVGLGEVKPLHPGGKWVTIALMTVGIGIVLYALTTLAETVLRSLTSPRRHVRQVEKRMHKLQNHVIVCGFGQVGEQVCHALHEAGYSFALIERDPARVRHAQSLGYLVLEDDATHDDALRRAGIERANTLVTVLDSDASNLYVTLSARQLGARVSIIARSNAPESAHKLERAGADRVVNPYRASGLSMASLVLRPSLAEFVEKITLGNLDFRLEEIRLGPDSGLIGSDAAQLARLGVTVVAVRGADGSIRRSSSQLHLRAGDVLLAIGTDVEMQALEAAAGSDARNRGA